MSGALGRLLRYPTAAAGLAVVALLLAMAAWAVIAIPYREAIRLWQGGEAAWLENPRNARPVWLSWLPASELTRTLDVRSEAGLRGEDLGGGVRQLTIRLAFDYRHRRLPPEIAVVLDPAPGGAAAHVSLRWRTPDGTELRLRELAVERREIYRLGSDARLEAELGGRPEHVLLGDPERPGEALRGRHELVVAALLFGEGSRLDARLIVYGEAHGLAGTDHMRRDLMVALLWGTPIALAFGLLAAVGSTVTTLVIAAVGAWYGRWVDALIQRVTEVALILPFLPLLVMIGVLYSRSIWVMLGVVILFGVFSSGIKSYRALFLQVKEAPYIEAARAYGAGGLRVVLLYMVPRAVPVLIPQFVTLIPAFVFLEASLAILGLGDPVLPTWGKVLEDAFSRGALFSGHLYWVLQPAALLMLSGLGFTMLGYALDRVFNPRLREIS